LYQIWNKACTVQSFPKPAAIYDNIAKEKKNNQNEGTKYEFQALDRWDSLVLVWDSLFYMG